MAKANSRRRIALQLEPRVALEAIILNQLERIPSTRRQEWLRGLVVQGFLIERRALQGLAVERTSRIGAGFPDWLAGKSTKQAALPKREPMPAAATGSDAVHDARKPFAQLRRVIG
ncbi:MAG: hypothetical protein KZQ87_12815 [Candidatus Thiodiazotropha sp. (ex Cardiolucina cf. quadrata)]|nr:hypothetical protein [Candidatus Thiodiazotropha sp. (ex Cardiolucina cf. quadrata)]